jgi:hypothetical protein
MAVNVAVCHDWVVAAPAGTRTRLERTPGFWAIHETAGDLAQREGVRHTLMKNPVISMGLNSGFPDFSLVLPPSPRRIARPPASAPSRCSACSAPRRAPAVVARGGTAALCDAKNCAARKVAAMRDSVCLCAKAWPSEGAEQVVT